MKDNRDLSQANNPTNRQTNPKYNNIISGYHIPDNKNLALPILFEIYTKQTENANFRREKRPPANLRLPTLIVPAKLKRMSTNMHKKRQNSRLALNSRPSSRLSALSDYNSSVPSNRSSLESNVSNYSNFSVLSNISTVSNKTNKTSKYLKPIDKKSCEKHENPKQSINSLKTNGNKLVLPDILSKNRDNRTIPRLPSVVLEESEPVSRVSDYPLDFGERSSFIEENQ